MTDPHAGERWDWEYTIRGSGRRRALPIVDSVIEIAQPEQRLLYIGIGDGRNFLPLIDAGLDVVGSEISRVSIDRLLEERPSVANRAFFGSFDDVFARADLFDGVVVSRVLVDSDLIATEARLRSVRGLLRTGGFIAAELTAAGTDPWPG